MPRIGEYLSAESERTQSHVSTNHSPTDSFPQQQKSTLDGVISKKLEIGSDGGDGSQNKKSNKQRKQKVTGKLSTALTTLESTNEPSGLKIHAGLDQEKAIAGEQSEAVSENVDIHLQFEGVESKATDWNEMSVSSRRCSLSNARPQKLSTIPETQEVSTLQEPILWVAGLSEEELLAGTTNMVASHSESMHRSIDQMLEGTSKVPASLQILNQIDDVPTWPKRYHSKRHRIRSYEQISSSQHSDNAEKATFFSSWFKKCLHCTRHR